MHMKPVMRWISVLMLAGIAAACNDSVETDDPNARHTAEVAAFDDYLSANSISAIKDPSGVRMVIYKLGKGFPAKELIQNTLDVDYVGRFFPEGAIFDQGNTTLPLAKYINGWKIALGKLPEGSRARIYVPSYWAYGTAGSGSIPANTPLEFDLVFNKIVRTSAELTRLGSDSVAIDTYLANKAIEAVKDTVGIRYVVTQMGGGAMPGLFTKLKFKVSYKLLTDDTKVAGAAEFQPSEGYDSRACDQNVDALKRLLTMFPAGTKLTAYVPSLWGYGALDAKDNNNVVVIPANSNLILDIELNEIVTP